MSGTFTATAEDLIAFAADRRFHTILADPPSDFRTAPAKWRPSIGG